MPLLKYILYAVLTTAVSQDPLSVDSTRVQIVNTGKYMPYVATDLDGGPVVGNMLNFHYYPAINFFNGGRYVEAAEQFSYVLERMQYLDANPRQADFVSTAYYLR